MNHKKGVTTSFHNSGQGNIHVVTQSGETTIKNVNSSTNREIVIKNKDGSVVKKSSNSSDYKKVR